MATTLLVEPRAAAVRPAAVAQTRASAWHAYTVIVAAACVMVGVYWDISWHMSIGRDTFWTPAHLLIQAGGLLAGLSSGYVALRTSFAGTDEERARSVGFWGFRAPLGAWICVWGCGAMLTSAPFDNWWHDAYGLDVKIISPPHSVLAIGIFAIVVGALLLTLAQQNRATGAERTRFAWLLALSGGFFLMNFSLFLTEYSEKQNQHGPLFYQVVAGTFPLALALLSRAIRLRWSATAAAGFFTAIMLVLMWTIGLFPATPKLGPIYHHVTHMVTLGFPLLVIAPAIAIDLVMQRLDAKLGTMALAAVVGPAFVAAFMAVQWPFAVFLVENPLARGRLFNADNYVYWMAPAYEAGTRHFQHAHDAGWPVGWQLLLVVGIAILSSALGLGRGAWMRRVQR